MSTIRRRSHTLNFKIDDLGFRIAKNSSEQVHRQNIADNPSFIDFFPAFVDLSFQYKKHYATFAGCKY